MECVLILVGEWIRESVVRVELVMWVVGSFLGLGLKKVFVFEKI